MNKDVINIKDVSSVMDLSEKADIDGCVYIKKGQMMYCFAVIMPSSEFYEGIK